MAAEQKELFETAPAPWEADDAVDQFVATVVFPTGPSQPFDYIVPERLREKLRTGMRVRVPLGRGDRQAMGYCVCLETRQTTRRLKEISRLVDGRQLFSPAMLRLTEWMAEHYLCSWGQVLETVVPAGVRLDAGTRGTQFFSVNRAALAKVERSKLPPKQALVIEHLAAAPAPMTAPELAAACRCTMAPISTLRKKGLIDVRTERVRTRHTEEAAAERDTGHELNLDQQQALDSILAALRGRRYETLLLHGVTGSGKTEVYIRAIEEVVSYGRQAIVLVPEISLTPQTRQRFRARFDHVAVLHSHLSDSERHRHWERIAAGEIQVIVGARSAIFAPTPHLGLIVVDEEHESSFKQDSAPRYHARDVAIQRARAEAVPLVLGSATPSLESWQCARDGIYRLLELPRRVLDRPLPAVGTIDLREERAEKGSRGAIGRRLRVAMEHALDAGGQVILLLNRRGFATHIQCPSCGEVVNCPHCEIALTHHRHGEVALCHYCDYKQPAPTTCPKCGASGIRYGGSGTQRLEAEVHQRFPNYPIVRMDTDAMQKPGSHEAALARFRSGEVRILLGTQMIAKGLDFPNVTLVGVINADTSLHLPDFRAAERTFQLLAQVAGRTGRGEQGGRVLIQTVSPEHPAIEAAIHHDCEKFAAFELPMRQSLGYPPFGSMVRLIVRGPQEPTVAAFTAQVADELHRALNGAECRILGPAPAPFAKLRGKYRYHVLLQGPDGAPLRDAARKVLDTLRAPDEVEWVADVDPLTML